MTVITVISCNETAMASSGVGTFKSPFTTLYESLSYTHVRLEGYGALENSLAPLGT